jgi:hypothetical protein
LFVRGIDLSVTRGNPNDLLVLSQMQNLHRRKKDDGVRELNQVKVLLGKKSTFMHRHSSEACRSVVIQKKKKIDEKERKSQQIAHPILISHAAMSVERDLCCLPMHSKFDLKNRVKTTTTKRERGETGIWLFIKENIDADVSQGK